MLPVNTTYASINAANTAFNRSTGAPYWQEHQVMMQQHQQASRSGMQFNGGQAQTIGATPLAQPQLRSTEANGTAGNTLNYQA